MERGSLITPSLELGPRNVSASTNTSQPRSTIAAGAASARLRRANSTKTWIQSSHDATLDAREANIKVEEAQSVVRAVTRFATVMCILIAVLKVTVYIYSRSAVVKTSALDSAGDLLANAITLYTGHCMSHLDVKTYPAGQVRFEAIGVSVFSTVMASAMFANLLSNVETILSDPETSREEAVTAFMDATFAVSHGIVEGVEDFHDPEAGWRAMKIALLATPGPYPEFHQNVTMKAIDYRDVGHKAAWWVHETSEMEDPLLQARKIIHSCLFLSACALYKFGLWFFCVKVAIPRTNSQVLVALANDKFNDFISTSTVISIMALTFLASKHDLISDDVAEKMDPGASILISVFIIHSWIVLLREQLVVLAQRTVEEDILGPLRNSCLECASGFPCGIGDVKCYYTSYKYTVEIALWVGGTASFAEVSACMRTLSSRIGAYEDVEKVLVLPSAHALSQDA